MKDLLQPNRLIGDEKYLAQLLCAPSLFKWGEYEGDLNFDPGPHFGPYLNWLLNMHKLQPILFKTKQSEMWCVKGQGSSGQKMFSLGISNEMSMTLMDGAAREAGEECNWEKMTQGVSKVHAVSLLYVFLDVVLFTVNL